MAKNGLMLFAVASIAACGAAPDSAVGPGTRSAPTATRTVQLANSVLEIRPVRYEGSTNGYMVIDVLNPSESTQVFSAEGMYFIPEEDPSHAPQRVGAVGPFTRDAEIEGASFEDVIGVEPSKTVRLRLGVFCIDRSRPSPSNSTRFYVANQLMPGDLTRAIYGGAKRIILDNGGDVDASRDAIQDLVWAMRDQGRLRLQGE